MKLKTFINSFDRFADAPNAVERIRQLVRHLAVTGKLVSQDASDEPAEQLLSRVTAGLSNKKSENPFLGEIKPTITEESRYNLPPGWAWLPLGHIGIWATGCGFPTQYQGESDRDFLFCKVSDMNLPGNEVEIHKTVHSIDAGVMKLIKARANPVGTVIFPKIGGAIATHKRRLVIKPTIIDNNCSGIQPIGLTDERWLLLLMRNLDLTKYQSGTSVPAVSQGSLDPIRVGLPPLAEQKRIVAKVDELMALCERLEVQLKERETKRAVLSRAALSRFADTPTPVNLELLFHKSFAVSTADLRKTILTLAVQGKLVRQDPNDEPASVSVGVVAKAAKKAICEGIIRRHGLDEPADNSEMHEQPLGWRWTRLTEITRPVPYAIKRGPFGSAIRKDMFVPKGFKVYEQQHAISGDFTKGRYYINEEKFKELSAFELHPNEIIVSCSGTVGKVAIVPKNIERGIINQALLKLSLHQSALLNEYFLILFPAFFMETDTLTNLSGTAQKNIPGMDVLKVMPFPLPPLAEQRRIVARVGQLMTLVDKLDAQLAASHSAAEKLMDAAVAELTKVPCP